MNFAVFVILILVAGGSLGLGIVCRLLNQESNWQIVFFAISGACAFGAVMGWLR